MPPFSPFSHYLAFLATDQQTFLALKGFYDGIVVPATIAAWQKQGTGGFVLSLSATDNAPPYVIDPRFPLFQQRLPSAKQSHLALAELLDDSALVQSTDPLPTSFTTNRLSDLATKWVEFNLGFATAANKTFDKYAERLGEPIPQPKDAQKPETILAPYFAVSGPADPWWTNSKALFDFTKVAADGHPCHRVVCATDASSLDPLLKDIGVEDVVIWVSGLQETRAPLQDLSVYRQAIEGAAARGQGLFALYGGFFSVLLGSFGLQGAAHGVGFSEHRDWRELPRSGAAPPRYYVRRIHGYLPQDLAETLCELAPALTMCPCSHCAGRPPIALDYHDLMKHSVWCRHEEIREWFDLSPTDSRQRLLEEFATMREEILGASLPPIQRARVLASIDPLPVWARALTE